MGTDKEGEEIKRVIAKFPETFKLRNHEGTFRISAFQSYFTGPGECGGSLMLYTQCLWTPEKYLSVYGKSHRREEDLWVDFAKGTEAELSRNIRRES